MRADPPRVPDLGSGRCVSKTAVGEEKAFFAERRFAGDRGVGGVGEGSNRVQTAPASPRATLPDTEGVGTCDTRSAAATIPDDVRGRSASTAPSSPTVAHGVGMCRRTTSGFVARAARGVTQDHRRVGSWASRWPPPDVTTGVHRPPLFGRKSRTPGRSQPTVVPSWREIPPGIAGSPAACRARRRSPSPRSSPGARLRRCSHREVEGTSRPGVGDAEHIPGVNRIPLRNLSPAARMGDVDSPSGQPGCALV